ncbi:DNA primase [Candidatus Woesebacteria bacterium RIFCSPHIGHO2_01_FULL_44_21]|uniref:DNA primase n=1 Tax=Candidatus Woesebacteria bacterium RIFCSPHIGHO2_01_FULL_44_21 TaxID=1802503 RepID=A0A1F7YZN2_9BACT|nr:MAG: DNA primase [Candidatus Woesebacteria bacterium RIFCSPHIGHO2_01_FULL_44_21]OGM70830.1 MAG: DNA primase [Candidatus Woesebacteria bacterium RIFCSPLOWO2_01_FULL_44_24b]
MDDVTEVKQKTDIVAIVGEQVKLTRAGRNFKGLCPFHDERTPSFMVSPELQIYKCFGCGESGDVFTFLEKHEGTEFYEALKYLADRAGVKLAPRSGQDTSLKTQVLEANELAAKFYHYILTKHTLGKPGAAYLRKRGVEVETVKKFNLGFAPQDGNILGSALSKKKNIKFEILEGAGLVFKSRGGYMDRFRERVIFPIRSARGETVALAGRILPEYDSGKVGKYINSPETVVYHKSSSLYGLDVTKDDIRKTRSAVVVEGELDLLSSWQAGVKNIVAIKGTALTDEHVRILARFADTLIMALDSDFAGNSAAIRGLTFAQNAGLEIRVVNLGKYKDPDEFARAEPEEYKNAIKNATDAWEFVISVIAKRFDTATGPGKARASRQVTPILASIEDAIVRAHYVQKAANKLGVPVEAVAREVEKKGVSPKEVSESTPETDKPRRELLEERLLTLSIERPEMLVRDELKFIFSTPLNLKIAREIVNFALEHDSLDIPALGNKLPSELKEGFAGLVMQLKTDLIGSEHEGKLLKSELKELVLKERLNSLGKKIASLEAEGKGQELEKIEGEFQALSRELTELTRGS